MLSEGRYYDPILVNKHEADVRRCMSVGSIAAASDRPAEQWWDDARNYLAFDKRGADARNAMIGNDLIDFEARGTNRVDGGTGEMATAGEVRPDRIRATLPLRPPRVRGEDVLVEPQLAAEPSTTETATGAMVAARAARWQR